MSLRQKLTLLFFLQLGVWGAYLTSMGSYLGSIGLGDHTGYFYSMQGLVSLFMPTLIGILADRYIEAQRLFGACHLISAAAMFLLGMAGLAYGDDASFGVLFPIYTVAVAFYMPTLGLANTISYTALQRSGYDKIAVFPKIRVFGTVGFLVTMWFVDIVGFQQSPKQFIVCGVVGLVLAFYGFTMPRCPVSREEENKSWLERTGLDAFRLFKNGRMAMFFTFSMLLGVALQITNGYANPFISSFGELGEFRDSFFTEHANLLISISQISETLCVLLIPFFLKRYGIKVVVLIAMTAWFLRFGLFAVGDPAWPGILCLILSMVVYGVAFDFFNISGSLFVDSEVEPRHRASAQGLFMLMTNGLGAAFGMLVAQEVVNAYVYSETDARAVVDGWHTCWRIFAAYAGVVAILFALLFKDKKKGEEV